MFITNYNYAQQLPGRRYIDPIFTQWTMDSVRYTADLSETDSVLPSPALLPTAAVQWYNNVTVYNYKPVGDQLSRRATFFLLPGGAFIKLMETANLDPGNAMPEAHSLAKKLVKAGYNVILVKYEVVPSGKKSDLINSLFSKINTTNILLGLYNPEQYGECKARLEEASLKSFHDFRKILRLHTTALL